MAQRRRISFTVAITLLTCCSVSHAAPPPRLDSVVGAGTIPVSLVYQNQFAGMRRGNLTVAAHSGPGGESPFGTMRVTFPGFTRSTASVECLYVNGNRAVAGGPIRAGAVTLGLFIVVEDNGANDRATAVLAFGGLPPCEDVYQLAFVDQLFPLFPIDGNYRVTDVSP